MGLEFDEKELWIQVDNKYRILRIKATSHYKLTETEERILRKHAVSNSQLHTMLKWYGYIHQCWCLFDDEDWVLFDELVPGLLVMRCLYS